MPRGLGYVDGNRSRLIVCGTGGKLPRKRKVNWLQGWDGIIERSVSPSTVNSDVSPLQIEIRWRREPVTTLGGSRVSVVLTVWDDILYRCE